MPRRSAGGSRRSSSKIGAPATRAQRWACPCAASAPALGVPLRADHPLRLPVDGEAMPRETGLRAGLPAEVATGRAQHLDANAREAGRAPLSSAGARVDKLPAREQVAVGHARADR